MVSRVKAARRPAAMLVAFFQPAARSTNDNKQAAIVPSLLARRFKAHTNVETSRNRKSKAKDKEKEKSKEPL